jgi:hypothetical protein
MGSRNGRKGITQRAQRFVKISGDSVGWVGLYVFTNSWIYMKFSIFNQRGVWRDRNTKDTSSIPISQYSYLFLIEGFLDITDPIAKNTINKISKRKAFDLWCQRL